MVSAREWFDRLIVLSLCAIIFTLPFSKSAIEICFTIAFALWILRKALFREPHISAKRIFGGVNSFIYLFVLANIMSTCFSASIALSLKGLFFKVLEGVLLFFIIADTVNNRQRLNIVLAAMFLSMLLMAIDGMFQAMTGCDFLRHYTKIDGIRASFFNRNGFGAWLVVMIPVVLGVIAVDKRQMPKRIIKSMAWIMAGILTLCLALTASRGALAGFVFALIFFLMVKNRKAFLIVAALILAASVFGMAYFVNADPDMGKFYTEFTRVRSWDGAVSLIKDFIVFVKWHMAPVAVETNTIRVGLCWEALLIIKSFPVFGCGLNTYALVAPNHPGVLIGFYPHNSYLQMAAETGIVGLASFVLLMTALFAVSLAKIGKIKDGFYKGILTGLLAGLFGFLVHSFFDVHFYSLQLANLMWLIMGLIIAVQNTALGPEKDSLLKTENLLC